jgi:outer membrane protein insertion porin family
MSPAGVLTITINEGVIEGIIVKGNDKTKPNVITRELKQKPGDVFNTNDAQRSIQRLSNLGFFEDVSMKLNPGREPNGVVLETDVKEQKTGSFSIGAGYSADNGLVGILGIGDKNFHGTGDAINIETQLGGNTNSAGFTFSYVIPWLDSKHTSLSFSLFDAETQYTDYGLPNQPDNTQRSTYDRRSEGVAVSLGRPEGEYVTNYFNLRSQSDKYISYVSGPVQYDAAPGSLLYNSAFNAQYLANNFGVTNSVGVSRVFDNRDNVFNPTKGNRFEVGCEFAGRVFGSNFSYNKYVLDERQYFDLGKEHVLALRVQGGYATGNMPQSGLFVVGGADTLRGYEDYEFSGTRMVTATAEYRFPIIQKVEGVLFTDMGNAWDNGWSNTPGMHSSVGVGLRMNSPLGPIRVDLGKGSEGTRGDFSFGGQF